MTGVIGHKRNLKFLEDSIVSGRVAHAYLFYGPEHVGKTATAEEFGKGFLCERKTIGGCGACSSCTVFGRNGAFIELKPGVPFVPDEDGEGVSIKEIREVRRILGLEMPRRVVLIIEAERMTMPAAHAFLKILEEPLPGTMFILTARDRSRILPTIQSRTVPLRFSRVAPKELHAVRGATAELVEMSLGLPGKLTAMIADKTCRIQEAQRFHDAERSVSALRGAALAVAEKYSGEENEEFIMHLFCRIAGDVARYTENHQRVRRVRAALRALKMIRTTNVNRRLAWDILMLNSRLRL